MYYLKLSLVVLIYCVTFKDLILNKDLVNKVVERREQGVLSAQASFRGPAVVKRNADWSCLSCVLYRFWYWTCFLDLLRIFFIDKAIEICK